MFDDRRSFVTRAFLRAELDLEFKVYAASGADVALLERLRQWNERSPRLTEVQLEQSFIQAFFVETWSYASTGGGGDHTFGCR